MAITGLGDIPCSPNCHCTHCENNDARIEHSKALRDAWDAGDMEAAHTSAQAAMRVGATFPLMSYLSGLPVGDCAFAYRWEEVKDLEAELKGALDAGDLEKAHSAAWSLSCWSIPAEDTAERTGCEVDAIYGARQHQGEI